jgi:hypothetical protein
VIIFCISVDHFRSFLRRFRQLLLTRFDFLWSDNFGFFDYSNWRLVG